MHLENLSSLSSQLDQIGFKNMTASLAKRICLLPASFTITKRLIINSDELFFEFVFKKEAESQLYYLDYFDAGFQKYLQLNGLTINGIKAEELDGQMKNVDWKTVFDFSETPDKEQETILSISVQAEKIMQQFEELSHTEQGKQLVVQLKQKYWSQFPAHPLMGPANSPRATTEILQRIYCCGQQTFVTTQDVYRFLQLKRIEKEMRGKGKSQSDSTLNRTKSNAEKGKNKTGTIKAVHKSNNSEK